MQFTEEDYELVFGIPLVKQISNKIAEAYGSEAKYKGLFGICKSLSEAVGLDQKPNSFYTRARLEDVEKECIKHMSDLDKKGDDSSDLADLLDDISVRKEMLSDEIAQEHDLKQVRGWEEYAALSSKNPASLLKNIVLTVYHSFWHGSRNNALKNIAEELAYKTKDLEKKEIDMPLAFNSYIRRQETELANKTDLINEKKLRYHCQLDGMSSDYTSCRIASNTCDYEKQNRLYQIMHSLRKQMDEVFHELNKLNDFKPEIYVKQIERKKERFKRKINYICTLKKACVAANENIQNAMKKRRKFIAGLFS